MDLDARAVAVVDKTHNLVSLDVEAMYLKWQESMEAIKHLSGVVGKAQTLADDTLERQPEQFTGRNVIDANTTVILVKTQLNEAKHLHALALAGLERATAGAFRIYPIPAPPVPPDKK
jgi:outer membrane protein TolC